MEEPNVIHSKSSNQTEGPFHLKQGPSMVGPLKQNPMILLPHVVSVAEIEKALLNAIRRYFSYTVYNFKNLTTFDLLSLLMFENILGF